MEDQDSMPPPSGDVSFSSTNADTRMDSMWAAFDDFDNLDGTLGDGHGLELELDFEKLIAKASPSPAGSMRRDLSMPAEQAYQPSRSMRGAGATDLPPFQVPLLPPSSLSEASSSSPAYASTLSGGAAAAASATSAGGVSISRDLEQAVEAQLPQLPEALGKRPRTADPAQRLQRSRERKCFHAKRSRLRKKFFLQSLQALRADMERRNVALAAAVTAHLPPDVAQRALEAAKQATSKERPLDEGGVGAEGAVSSPMAAAAAAAEKLAGSFGGHAADPAPAAAGSAGSHFIDALDPCDSALVRSIASSMQNFVITNPRAPDNPIIFASEQFYKLTGFPPSEVIGFNCRFLQGPGTDPRAVQLIREGLHRGEDISVCLRNYRKDGSSFFNQFFLAPLRGSSGEVENYVGVQAPVSEDHFKKVCEKQFELAELKRKMRDDATASKLSAGQRKPMAPLRPGQMSPKLLKTASSDVSTSSSSSSTTTTLTKVEEEDDGRRKSARSRQPSRRAVTAH